MYTPHVVTVYNVHRETDTAMMQDTAEIYITVLANAFLTRSEAAETKGGGKVGAGEAKLYIPFTVRAEDGESGETKRYVPPDEFWGAKDRSGIWTLSVDGGNGETWFAKDGVVTKAVSEVTEQEGCFRVTKVRAMDFGAMDMQHWEVQGG